MDIFWLKASDEPKRLVIEFFSLHVHVAYTHSLFDHATYHAPPPKKNLNGFAQFPQPLARIGGPALSDGYANAIN